MLNHALEIQPGNGGVPRLFMTRDKNGLFGPKRTPYYVVLTDGSLKASLGNNLPTPEFLTASSRSGSLENPRGSRA